MATNEKYKVAKRTVTVWERATNVAVDTFKYVRGRMRGFVGKGKTFDIRFCADNTRIKRGIIGSDSLDSGSKAFNAYMPH